MISNSDLAIESNKEVAAIMAAIEEAYREFVSQIARVKSNTGVKPPNKVASGDGRDNSRSEI